MQENTSVPPESPLLVSMTVREVHLASTGEDKRLEAFSDVVAERADGIELFVGQLNAFMSATLDAARKAASSGLSIRTVHAPPIGVRGGGLGGRWNVELNTNIKEIVLNYERNESAVGQPEPQPNPTESVVKRSPTMEPSVVTTHAPRFPVESEVSLAAARRQLVETIRSSTDHISGDSFVDYPWAPPPIALENVCPRSGFDYLLTTPGDAEHLREVAEHLGDGSVLSFTCDVGHTARPASMLDAMKSPASIHLHGVSEASTAAIVEQLPDDIAPSALAVEPADGAVHHLPPHRFPERTTAALDWIDDADHQCPLVVELQQPCKTPTVARELFDWFDQLR